VGGDATCRPAVELAKKIAPFGAWRGAAVNVAKSPLRIPDLAFQDSAGKPLTLANWHGRTVLLNLWATWCVPCRKEMPALDTLEQRLGGPRFEVVTVNIDTRDADKPKAWLNEIGVQKLALLCRSDGTRVSGSQGHRPCVRHADDTFDRSAGLRDRRHRRTG
jgi:thiol-disulfide isomerase/thioredoxin